MLRVRPIHFTSRLDQWEQLLSTLGMVKTVDDSSWKEFDAASGRLAVHAPAIQSAEDGVTIFGVEVGDLAEFERRTNQAASASGKEPAQLIEAEHGDSCRVRSEDGFTFLADKAAHMANYADADPALTVVEVWFTEDTAAATEILNYVGARPRPVPDNDETADFTAKNGGVIMVRPGSGAPRAGLGFEYDGDLDALADRLISTGYEVRLTEEAFARSLHVNTPDGGPALWISQIAHAH